jgi:hypothetical protein
MTRRIPRWIAGAALVTVGLVALGRADEAATLVPAADYPKLVAASTKIIQESLAGEVDKKTATKAKTQAAMIAAYAQLTTGSPAERATLRDAALQLAASLENGKYDDARQQAGRLGNLPVNPAANPQPVPLLEKHVYIEEVMGQFKLPRAGGLELESKLLRLGASGRISRALPETSLDEALQLTALQTAVTARLTREFVPEKNKKAWDEYCDEMEKAAVNLAAATRAKDAKAAYTALVQLNESCKKCHDDFR